MLVEGFAYLGVGDAGGAGLGARWQSEASESFVETAAGHAGSLGERGEGLVGVVAADELVVGQSH